MVDKAQIDDLAKESALSVIDLIKEYRSKNPSNNSKKLFSFDFKKKISEEIDNAINDFILSIENENDEQLSLEFANNIFEVMEALTSDIGIEENQLQEILVTGQTNIAKELIQTFIESHKEKTTFIQNLTNKLRDGILSNKNEKNTIKEYRKTPEARKDVKRAVKKESISIDEDIIQKFLSDMSVATKAEVLIKIEKYIDSGWFEIDNPLKSFYEDGYYKGNIDEAVRSLKFAMERRFEEAKFEKITEQQGNMIFRSYAIDILKERKKSIFNLAGSGEKDYCIPSADGTRYLIGDVTSEETGEINKNSWLNGLRAAKKYENENNIKIDYSVSIVSLFYDENQSKNELKGRFLTKLKNINQKFIDNFHYLQIISVLSRDTKSYDYNTMDLFKNLNVQFIGASSENFCNKMLSLDGEEFINETINIMNDTLDKLIKDRVEISGNKVFFNNEHDSSNVDSIPLSVLLRAISGLSNLVLDYPQTEEKYLALSSKIYDLQDTMTRSGEVFNMSANLILKMDAFNAFKRNELREKEKYEEFVAIKKEKENNYLKQLKNNNDLLEENKGVVASLIKDISCFLKSFETYNQDINKMTRATSLTIDNKVINEIDLVLKNYIENPYSQTKLISLKQISPVFVSDVLTGKNLPRVVMYQLSQAINISYGKNILSFVKYLDLSINAMEKLVSLDGSKSYIDSRCNVKSLQMARKNIDGLKDKTDQEIKDYLMINISDVNEFLSGLLVGIKEKSKLINEIVSEKKSVNKL